MEKKLLDKIHSEGNLSITEILKITITLSLPAILAQLSTIVMEYIDAAMVGHLGALSSASIGIVSTSIWLFGGVTTASVIGFSVQVSHAIGANDYDKARNILRQSIISCLAFCLFMFVVGLLIAPYLPIWLGGDESISKDATTYFSIFVMALPAWQLNYLGASMLRSTGNLKVPSILNVLCCLLDVVFNFFLIFPTRQINFLDTDVTIPGFGLGVAGAALGSVFAHVIVAILMLSYLFCVCPELKLKNTKGSFLPCKDTVLKSVKISLPMMSQHIVICGAQICTTAIVAPLGVIAIAANSFGITVESLCYMPGYGIGDAATSLVGLTCGAKRKNLAKQFAYTSVLLGMGVMAFMGVIMYIFAPLMMGIITPVDSIRELGAEVLRIEAWAEPMFAASIVAYGVFVGAGDTFKPFLMNFSTIWVVRITLAAMLAKEMGLRGVWIAMCVELCCRGLIFLIRLVRGNWLNKSFSKT